MYFSQQDLHRMFQEINTAFNQVLERLEEAEKDIEALKKRKSSQNRQKTLDKD